jgi:hypothetical protein
MAAGNTLVIFGPEGNRPPSSNYATLDTRNGHLVLDFDASADESAIFTGVMPQHYAGGSIVVYLHVTFSSATSGNADFEVAFERIGTTQDTDADSFAAAKAVNVAANGTNGIPTIASITFSQAEADGIVAGEYFRVKVTRDADDATNDTASGDAELLAVELREA